MSSGKRFPGKVVIVTASTDGIGLAIAKRLAEDGAHVMISSRTQKNVDAAVDQLRSEGLSVSGIVCHVAKEEHRRKLIEETLNRYGGIDILVSNAAANPAFEAVLSTSESVWDKIFEVNVKATFLLVKEIAPYIEKRGGGSIVLVSSIGGFVFGGLLGAYGTSKTAMFGLTKALVPQCAGMNIRINCIAPGLIRTRFSEALWKDPDVLADTLKSVPMNRIGEPSECAGVVSFLCSEDASYVTGETIVIAGGQSSRL
ncbi:dehydrogenase/reductase SDR family member 4-like isoform X1 [Ptychodera flava]|uniref:dehydrogenase/reductase SDR family member 4-like isoform X1 n=1 Tax=Ptychodera flava TaxID=63121 RepID=UPI003969C823